MEGASPDACGKHGQVNHQGLRGRACHLTAARRACPVHSMADHSPTEAHREDVATPWPLRTPRLLLRPLEAGDAAGLLRMYADPEVTADYEIGTMTSIDEAEAVLATYLRHFHRFALIKDDDPMLIGTCGFGQWDPVSRMASFGYDLARPYWGQGLMREAGLAILDHGLSVMQLNRINALTTLYNVRSMRLLASLGFTEEARLAQFAYWKGEFHTMRVFGLLRKDFTLCTPTAPSR